MTENSLKAIRFDYSYRSKVTSLLTGSSRIYKLVKPYNKLSDAMYCAVRMFGDMNYEVLEDFFLHSIEADFSCGLTVKMMTATNENVLQRELKLQRIWHKFRQSPSLVSMDVCIELLQDVFASADEIAKFERMALREIKNG